MDANIKSVKSLFSGPISYRIPPFQRPYCWDLERQWEPLWDDVRQVAERHGAGSEVTPHFMGAIVLQPLSSSTGEVTKRFVIDGQQRLVTIQLLLRAAACGFSALHQDDRVKRMGGMIHNECHHSGNNQDNLVKIRQSHEGDRQTFQGIMQRAEELQDTLLSQAFSFFRQSIGKWLHDNPLLQHGEQRAEWLEAAVSEHLQFVAVDLDQGENPYTIFSTLNERGEILSPSDLIKNMLMQQAQVGEDEEKARKIWGVFEEDRWWLEQTRENNLKRTQADRFFDHWLTVRQRGTTRPPTRLAADFGNFLTYACKDGKQDIKDLVSDLNHSADIYRQIQRAQLADALSSDSLQRMHDLSIGAPMSMMLWLFAHETLSIETKRGVARVIESYIVRRKLMQWPANGLVDLFATLVEKVQDMREADLVSEVVDHLCAQSNKLRWPSPEEVQNQLVSQSMTKQKVVPKSVLVTMERYLRCCAQAEPLGDTSQLTLEHIMPRRWKEEDWPLPTYNAADRSELVERRKRRIEFLGNLTLMTPPHNSRVGTKSWSEKQRELKHSTLMLNKKLMDKAPLVWDEQAIAARSQELARVVLDVWPGPEEYRRLPGST